MTKKMKSPCLLKVTIAIVMVFVLSIPAFGAQVRSAVCGQCRNGRMMNITREEQVVYWYPCTHGYGGVNDYTYQTFRRVYYECNVCHIGTLVSQVQIGQGVGYGHN